MLAYKSIVGISVPFVLGVAISSLFPRSISSGFLFCQVSLFVCLTLLSLEVKGDRRGRWLPALFFCLGFFVYANGAYGTEFRPEWMPGTDGMLRTIGKVPFADERARSLVEALLTGRRDNLDRATVKAFRDSGAAHILALSGLHLGIICLTLTRLLSFLGNGKPARVFRSIAILAFSTWYTLSTGAGASILRAYLFISMNEILKFFPGRRRKSLNVYCTALLIQLSLRPSDLGSVSFQLSYCAMLGICTVFPTLEDWWKGGPGLMHRMWTSMAISLSCQIFTAPVAWLSFGTFPKYFLLTNLIALPFSEALVVSSMLTVSLNAAGICPAFMIWITEKLADGLYRCLEIISSM